MILEVGRTSIYFASFLISLRWTYLRRDTVGKNIFLFQERVVELLGLSFLHIVKSTKEKQKCVLAMFRGNFPQVFNDKFQHILYNFEAQGLVNKKLLSKQRNSLCGKHEEENHSIQFALQLQIFTIHLNLALFIIQILSLKIMAILAIFKT